MGPQKRRALALSNAKKNAGIVLALENDGNESKRRKKEKKEGKQVFLFCFFKVEKGDEEVVPCFFKWRVGRIHARKRFEGKRRGVGRGSLLSWTTDL